MNEFGSREDASRAAAQSIEAAMRNALRERAPCPLIVSGGSSPLVTFELLSKAPLDWSQVQVTLTDERLVDVTDDRSNEKMVRANLLQGSASAAAFRPLDAGPLDHLQAGCALVGMGEDGHFASLFPDLVHLDTLLSPDAAPEARIVRTVASDVERISMNLSALLRSDLIVLLAFGDVKKQIINSPVGYPVDALLKQTKTPVDIYWAP